MARTAEAIIDDLLALPDGERARVLDAIVDMLGAPSAPSLEELRRRRDALESGVDDGIPGAELIRNLRRG